VQAKSALYNGVTFWSRCATITPFFELFVGRVPGMAINPDEHFQSA
jgi:hypothetical protein